ncbi:cytochrome c oxidase subunit 6C [Channa argus]|uniref:cytochrome c oxidase subunit 6C n=1 Tax=Channa argus TaxID=215402 RepID=UPI002947238B|nr:hypothetical protein Q8A73_006222 [Channa argus]
MVCLRFTYINFVPLYFLSLPVEKRRNIVLAVSFCEGRESNLCSTMSLPKPVMRGLLAKRLRFHLPIAFALAVTAAITFRYTVGEPRKQAYAEFYKQYDTTKEFNAMREAGIFESVRPSGE